MPKIRNDHPSFRSNVRHSFYFQIKRVSLLIGTRLSITGMVKRTEVMVKCQVNKRLVGLRLTE